MTLLNFPPTNGQPTDGSFTYTANGVVYTWDGEKWTANTGGSGGMGTVHFTGDSPPPAGEATETDQWFNTNDGRLYTYTKNVNGVLVWADASPDSQGDQLWDRNGTTLEPVNAGDDVDLGTGDLSAAAGTFSGEVNGVTCFFNSTTAGVVGRFRNNNSTQPVIAIDQQTAGEHPALWVSDVNGNGNFTVANSGDVQIGAGVGVGNSPNITLNANGAIDWGGAGGTAVPGRLTWSTAAKDTVVTTLEVGSSVKIQSQGQTGARQSGTDWVPATSSERLKNKVGGEDPAQCWNLIKNIELFNYYYKDQEQSGPPNMGPMAERLGNQDPAMLLPAGSDEEGPLYTYNKPLLEMKALQALSTALTRIEALEAKVQQLEGGN